MGRRKTYIVAECSNYRRQVNPEEDVEYTYLWCLQSACTKKKITNNENKNDVTSTSRWRLSELMGKQLEDNNPQITHLTDPNRPQRLSEMLSDIFDNEWLKACTGLQSQDENLDEQSAVDILFNLLKVIYEKTLDQVGKFASHIQEWFLGDQQCPHSRIIDFVVSISSCVIQQLQTEIEKVLSAKFKDSTISICTIYIQRCVKMCFYMRVKSPEMYLQFDCDIKNIDKTSFKPYTKDGDILDYVVWPALFLFKEGPLMNRGVVQCK